MTLAGWAGVTRRVRLGLLVGANTFRNPGVVAKMVTTLDHMSSRYIVVNRGGGVQGDAKLRVSLDGPSGKTDPQGRIVLVKDGGDVRIVRMRLNAEGRDTKSVAFGSDVVRAIVIASNASTRFTRCWQGNGTWSCWGTPVDENESFRVTASLVQ